jgi:hypothetical protein
VSSDELCEKAPLETENGGRRRSEGLEPIESVAFSRSFWPPEEHGVPTRGSYREDSEKSGREGQECSDGSNRRTYKWPRRVAPGGNFGSSQAGSAGVLLNLGPGFAESRRRNPAWLSWKLGVGLAELELSELHFVALGLRENHPIGARKPGGGYRTKGLSGSLDFPIESELTPGDPKTTRCWSRCTPTIPEYGERHGEVRGGSLLTDA